MGNTCCSENQGSPVDVIQSKESDPTPPPFGEPAQDRRNEPIPPPEPNDPISPPEPKCSPTDILEVILNKRPNSVLGLDVDWGELDKLKITKIKEGLFQQWNLANTDKAVKIGDSIVQVNDVKGDAKALLEAVKASEWLEIKISRTAPSA